MYLRSRIPRLAHRYRRVVPVRAYSQALRHLPLKNNLQWKLAIGSIAVLVSGSYLLTPNEIRLDSPPTGTPVSSEELSKHTTLQSRIWVAINGDVYDLTDFLSLHPGGAKIIMHYAGKNASKIFNKYHAKDFFAKFLTPESYVGPLIDELDEEPDITESGDAEERKRMMENKPPLSDMFNLSDFEYVAKQILPPNAWAYYSSAADDEISLRENHYAYHRIFFHPKVLVDVSEIDISTEFLGEKVDAPFYCSAAAQARLGNEDGELSIARGCGDENIIQMISSQASFSFDEITDAKPDGANQWFQLYVLPDREKAYDAIKACEKKDIKGIFVTVDTALLGRREKDLRHRVFSTGDGDDNEVTAFVAENDPIMAFKDPILTWKDIQKFKEATDIPIAIKGVQRLEDVLIAIDNGVSAVVLSNHGGRQLDFARSPVEILAEVMPVLRERGLDKKIEVYVDGGISRGSDVIKALCLGAKGVGLGRAFLYANSAYGEDGVKKAIQLLKSEMYLDMKLLGVSKIEDLTPDLLDLRNLYARPHLNDYLYNQTYEPLQSPKFREPQD
ncbi:Cytochrome b2, mitochondrial precursor [Scheffersomyces spartinae]|uniref:L-lactate dehydrogenase (cytochrome) n=1 Tax=Scheffersomyces spartinae TaxID=45513 RepID=A0A9P7V906_9ASCO|nr:Cytochrome b2, mitochondrial precursor [Scheffersomyces spartinae]KAG7193630.1 Cytochrome b2, mitochondrial precursor [Scheffersomyces spartinae]